MESIQILGAYGGKSAEHGTTTLLLSDHITIDAGNIMRPLGPLAQLIDHIFLTHSHLDHIADIPFLIDAFFNERTTPLNIYGLPATIEAIKRYIFNWEIWPDFNEINLINQNDKAVLFHSISIAEQYTVNGITLEPFATNHTVPSCGYIIKKGNNKLMFTADTYKCPSIWERLNNDREIKALIIEVSFPSRFPKLAEDSRHLTPALLKEELSHLSRNDIALYINHLKPVYMDEIRNELAALGMNNIVTILHDNYKIIF
ncbi:MAG: 3',5'-cyclic-nucleotide phosphodiesterase [Campylobacterales bacterium]